MQFVPDKISRLICRVTKEYAKPNTHPHEMTFQYTPFCFYDCMYTRWTDKGTKWNLLSEGSGDWKRMANIVPSRLCALDPVWAETATEKIALSIQGGRVCKTKGHILSVLLTQLDERVSFLYDVFEDTDDVVTMSTYRSEI